MDFFSAEKIKRPWLPKSKEGKKAVLFTVLTTAWWILLIVLPFPDRWIEIWWAQVLAGGPPRILVLLVLLSFGFYYQRKTMFEIKDRAKLVLALFVLYCLIAAFWIFFLFGEIFFEH